MSHPIIWTSKTEYYDEETGLQISKQNAKLNYIIIKHDKTVTFNYTKTKGHILNHVLCQLNPQLKLTL